MSDSDTVEMIHEDELPGHESKLEPKPDWEPRYPGSGRLKGKVALITGADSGIGRAVAALFAREGADIAISYLCEHDDAEKTKAIVEKEGRKAITIAGDLGDKDLLRRGGQADRRGARRPRHPRQQCRRAALGQGHPRHHEEQLKRTFQTNIFSMFYLTQAARPHLKKGSAIVNCTSVTMYKGSRAAARLFSRPRARSPPSPAR